MDAPPFITGFLGYAYAAAGEGARAEASIAELNQMPSRRFVSPFCFAIIYLDLGDKRRALDGLEKAYEARSQWLTLLKVDRVFDPLRYDSRFIELLKKCIWTSDSECYLRIHSRGDYIAYNTLE